MTTANATYRTSERPSDAGWILRGARNGVIAGLAMAMVMMMLGLIDQGFFAAPSSIWAFFAGPAAYRPHDLDVSVVLGAMGHMMNSAVLGLAFAFVATRVLRLSGTLPSVASGIVFALAALAVMWFAVLPLGANGEIVKGAAAVWIWVMGHTVFGAVGGWLSWNWR
ncbi:MAG: hypothetical protein WEE03_12115 [Chloroflexota bacterium]